MLYLSVKAVHILAVISWMAGLLYLPRLFVYHTNSSIGSSENETFKIMERRLYKGIMIPAMIFTWLTGLSLSIYGSFYTDRWFQAKFALVIFLTIVHFYLRSFIILFFLGHRVRSGRFFRILNEVPTLLMIGIVFLVVLRPL